MSDASFSRSFSSASRSAGYSSPRTGKKPAKTIGLAGRDVSDLPCGEPLDRYGIRREDAELEQLGLLLRGHEQDAVALADAPVDDPDVRDHALVRVVVRVEDERAQ